MYERATKSKPGKEGLPACLQPKTTEQKKADTKGHSKKQQQEEEERLSDW